ncbi:peptidase M24, structural domain-containing protein [Pilobolus umbonatus]|nr:peptidase M24, structural domain-containing protein [Pilobolus umbonatus]
MSTNMEISVAYPPSKFALDNNLSNKEAFEKYLLAADVVNHVLPEVISRVGDGVSVADLCKYGDDLIEGHTLNKFKSTERGVAVPTCISVNSIVQYYSPLPENDYHLKMGDVVKIELGAHINGYIVTSAHTVIVGTTHEPVTGKTADAICATHFAYQAAIRMLRPGVKSSEITKVINEIAAYFRCSPVDGTFSSPMKRFVLRAGKDIENRFPDDLLVQDLDKFDFEIEADQVYQINIMMSTGDGQVKNTEYKPFVYQRDVNKSYQLKLKSARQAYTEINDQHTVFPFATRSLSNNAVRLGLTSLLEHQLINGYPVMRTRDSNDIATQIKGTVLVKSDGPLLATRSLPLPYIHSQYSIPQNTTAYNVLSTPAVKEIRVAKPLPALTTPMNLS